MIVAYPVGQVKRARVSGFSILIALSGEKRGIGRANSEVENDEEGLKTMQTLGPNMT